VGAQRSGDPLTLKEEELLMKRRAVLLGAAATSVVVSAASSASAETWPDKPITMVVPAPPGGGTDLVARLYSDRLSETLGQQVIIDNRGGGNGNVGTAIVARAKPDGYTLLMQYSAFHSANPALIKNLNWKPEDFVGVAMGAVGPHVIVIAKKVPADDLKGFIAYAKANPGKINYGSAGPGTPQNISCELFKMMAGVELVHIPYRGGAPAITDLVAGHLHVIFAPLSESIEHVKAGKLRALAVTTTARLDVLPDVPTVADFVPGYEASGFAGIGVPSNTPADIIDLLNKELNLGLADARIKTRIVELGGTVAGGTPAEFATILSEATEKWAKVIKAAGIKAE
jgi:tripartite-type tricarboxylate transporter receptor subunit TctC